jgi:hypothetical protein
MKNKFTQQPCSIAAVVYQSRCRVYWLLLLIYLSAIDLSITDYDDDDDDDDEYYYFLQSTMYVARSKHNLTLQNGSG